MASPLPTKPTVAIVGATGAVGLEFLSVLADRDFPIGELRLLASARSAGKQITFRNKAHTVDELTEASFGGVDIALFSAGGSISKKYAPIARDAGAVVIDNSSAFRMTSGVPLVIPEVNPESLDASDAVSGDERGRIIANPNCSTIIMLVPITPIHRAVGVKRIVASTYQAASGAGAAAMAELDQQTREVLVGKPPTQEIFPHQYAFNLFSHNSEIGPDSHGYNTEEVKMVTETHKIWGDPDILVTATCIRVPIMRAHAESIHLELAAPLSDDQARELLDNAPGVTVHDDRDANRFPTPLDATGKDDVLVGRIRNDLPTSDKGASNLSLNLFVCGDQLRKGAALNAVQIAELLLD